MKDGFAKNWKKGSSQERYVTWAWRWLAEVWHRGGARGRHLTSRIDVGMRDDHRQPRGFMKGEIHPWRQSVNALLVWTALGLKTGSPRSVLLYLFSGFKRLFSPPPLWQHSTNRGPVNVSREGKWAPSLSFITQVSTEFGIFWFRGTFLAHTWMVGIRTFRRRSPGCPQYGAATMSSG